MPITAAEAVGRGRQNVESFDQDHCCGRMPAGAGSGRSVPSRSGDAHAHYQLADVFTAEPFGGNPLALFADASAIPDAWLQPIAAELNLSETAFAYPLGDAEWRLRIFTPTMEHPFAGHPTIGSALLLAERDQLTSLTLHEKVGPVAITIDRPTGRPPIARLAVPMDPEEQPVAIRHDEIAAMLSLAPEQVERGPLQPRAMSCGVPFLFIRVADRNALRGARLNKDRWQALLADCWAPHVYVYSAEPSPAGEHRIDARMFAPLMGIDEDPATGGAAAALAGVLAAQQPGRMGEACWIIAQGVDMGRPSRLELTAEVAAGRATRIRVGGSAVAMGRGSLDLTSMEEGR